MLSAAHRYDAHLRCRRTTHVLTRVCQVLSVHSVLVASRLVAPLDVATTRLASCPLHHSLAWAPGESNAALQRQLCLFDLDDFRSGEEHRAVCAIGKEANDVVIAVVLQQKAAQQVTVSVMRQTVVW